MAKEKKQIKELKKKLFFKKRLVFDELKEQERKKALEIGDMYKGFLNNAKTEREAVKEIVKRAEQKGFVNIENVAQRLVLGKFYKVYREKCITLGIKGKKPLKSGIRIIGSHIDSPRLDLKQQPVYENQELVFLKTHYYGGIKKYQWVTRPLAIHGKLIKENADSSGSKEVDITIGENSTDPVLTVLDLLPHLAKKQMEKKLSEAIEGEKLNLLSGSIPFKDKEIKDRFKLNFLRLLNEKYGIIEEDFISAEIEIVPAGLARDVGLDKSLVGAYGQDDRICAYTSLQAILEIYQPEHSCIVSFFDKEEIGSEGSTGAKSWFMRNMIGDFLSLEREKWSIKDLSEVLIASRALSADVNAGLDPDYPDVHEKQNAAMIGHGICVTKFTGARGKAGSSDADAEFVGWLRHIFNKNNIIWQTGELGKVDEGGGGTIAKHLANLGINTIDCGTPILSMHSPFEVSSKFDLYMTYKAYKAFLEN